MFFESILTTHFCQIQGWCWICFGNRCLSRGTAMAVGCACFDVHVAARPHFLTPNPAVDRQQTLAAGPWSFVYGHHARHHHLQRNHQERSMKLPVCSGSKAYFHFHLWLFPLFEKFLPTRSSGSKKFVPGSVLSSGSKHFNSLRMPKVLSCNPTLWPLMLLGAQLTETRPFPFGRSSYRKWNQLEIQGRGKKNPDVFCFQKGHLNDSRIDPGLSVFICWSWRFSIWHSIRFRALTHLAEKTSCDARDNGPTAVECVRPVEMKYSEAQKPHGPSKRNQRHPTWKRGKDSVEVSQCFGRGQTDLRWVKISTTTKNQPVSNPVGKARGINQHFSPPGFLQWIPQQLATETWLCKIWANGRCHFFGWFSISKFFEWGLLWTTSNRRMGKANPGTCL